MSVERSLPVLERVRIASPCPAQWGAMAGGQRTRDCHMCGLHVHNVEAMTSEEAGALLVRAKSERVCARPHRRADGTIITRDCPVGLRLRQRARRTVARAAAAVLLLVFGGLASREGGRGWELLIALGLRAEPVQPREDPEVEQGVIIEWNERLDDGVGGA
jgi:hypothetical protein